MLLFKYLKKCLFTVLNGRGEVPQASHVCNMDLIDLITQVSPHLYVEKLKLATNVSTLSVTQSFF